MRKSGILLHISSLPGEYGIGSLGKEAYEFVDHLYKSKQKLWQILPLTPTGYGDSPYQSFSTFAGNPYFINIEEFYQNGWITEEDLNAAKDESALIDYSKLYVTRFELLKKAYRNSQIQENSEFIQYCENEKSWLKDYSLYMAIKDKFEGKPWNEWPEEFKLRYKESLNEVSSQLHDEIVFYQFLQFIFWKQWKSLKSYANERNIEIIGDIPIYVAYDSADTWANPELFKLDAQLSPEAVAGVPPDGFSADGQLWGNPLYKWDYHKEMKYSWWIQRMKSCVDHYDIVRIDHFRGFDEYFSVPFGDDTARNGHWEKGPGYDLFKTIQEELGDIQVIAEDLGYLTDSVKKLVKDCGYPGMKIFEFAFDSRDSSGANDYLPHNYIENSVVYTGTHDNETMMGWFESILPEEKETLKNYLCTTCDENKELLLKSIAMVMRSVSKWCVIPMQDWLGYDNHARMNVPSTSGQNWKWKMKKFEFTQELEEMISQFTSRYGRV